MLKTEKYSDIAKDLEDSGLRVMLGLGRRIVLNTPQSNRFIEPGKNQDYDKNVGGGIMLAFGD